MVDELCVMGYTEDDISSLNPVIELLKGATETSTEDIPKDTEANSDTDVPETPADSTDETP